MPLSVGEMQCGETNSIFQRECDKIIQSLQIDDCEIFKTLKNDEERVGFMYNFAKAMPISLKDGGKCLETAQEKKIEGNKLFAEKKYENAITVYSEGIVRSPQNEGTGDIWFRLFTGNYFYRARKRAIDDFDFESERNVFRNETLQSSTNRHRLFNSNNWLS